MDEDPEKTEREALKTSGQSDEERHRLAKEQALEGFFALTRVMGLMATLAAPRFLARIPTDDFTKLEPERILKLLDGYLATIEASKTGEFADQDGNIRRTEEAARRSRILLESWEYSRQVPAPLLQAARDFLKAFGVPEPEEGWDQCEGPSDEVCNRDRAYRK